MSRRDLPIKRAERQERGLVKQFGGRRQPGSGNQWHSQGDAKLSRFLVEAKYTDKQQYPLKRREIEALRKKALFEQREWALQVDLGDLRLVVLPLSALEELEDRIDE